MASAIRSVKVAYAEFPPFVEILQDENGEEIIDGFMPEIVRGVTKWMKLEVQWIREPEDQYGTWANNTWTGMCGMLSRKEVDFIVNPVLPDDLYAEVAFYTNPVIFEAYTFLSGKQKMDSGFFLYFSVLDPVVWLSIGIALVVIVLTSVVVYLRISHTSEMWISVVSEYFWVYFAYMLRQAPNEKWILRNRRNRRSLIFLLMPLLISLWVLGVSFLIMTVFQSLLISKLVIVQSRPVVDSMEEFVKLKKLIGRTPKEIELQEVLRDSGIPIYEEAWSKLEPELVDIENTFTNENFRGVEEGRLTIIHGKLVLKTVLGDYFREHGTCNFHISPNEFFPFPLLMALQKGLPEDFLRKFNYGMTRLVDADISGKWFKSVEETSQLCTTYSDTTLKPLNLQNIYGVLMIWGVGLTVSIVVFTAETIFYSYTRNSSSHGTLSG